MQVFVYHTKTVIYVHMSVLNLKTFSQNPDGHPLWLESITAIPSDSFTEDYLEPDPVDGIQDYALQCGLNHYYIDINTEGKQFG